MTLLTCVTVLLTNNNTPFITKYKNMDLKKHFLSRKRTRSFDKKKFEHGSLVFKSLFFTQKLWRGIVIGILNLKPVHLVTLLTVRRGIYLILKYFPLLQKLFPPSPCVYSGGGRTDRTFMEFWPLKWEIWWLNRGVNEPNTLIPNLNPLFDWNAKVENNNK